MTKFLSVGETFAQAVANGDRDQLVGLLATDVHFRAITPGKMWELHSPDEVADVMLGMWFGGARHVDRVDNIDTDSFGGCERVGYRFAATTPEGPALVEQQAYLTVHNEMIVSLSLVCSGYRVVDACALPVR